MKYFKYKNINKVQKIADKERLASLGKDEQKKIVRSRRLIKALSICGIVFFIACFAMFIFFIKLIPIPTHSFLKVLRGIGCVLLGMLGLIVSMFTTMFTFGILISKVEYNLPQMRKEFLRKACEPIRNYYSISDEYLITKCFDSTNLLFNNHDICIFRYGNEIRITTDIVKGFINEHCDLGCYSIKFDELNIYKEDFNDKRVTVLEFGKEKFIIGIKAYSYINKLMKTKVYKYLFKSIEINNQYICVKNNKKIQKVDIDKIDKIELKIPQYTGIPGSGYSYFYTIKIFENCKNTIVLDIVLERNEEKELINFFNLNNIKFEVEYYDNRNEGSD
ncbi:MAG: hypothetical protein IJX78_05820 [Bacilli bacterium]|nr:hypothetical protein [Bacilli bacterium]